MCLLRFRGVLHPERSEGSLLPRKPSKFHACVPLFICFVLYSPIEYIYQKDGTMTTYVLGAGASRHAGYPLAASMGTQLFEWMRSHRSQAFDYPAVVEFLQRTFGNIENIEDLLTNIHKLIAEYKNGTPDQRAVRSVLANETRPAIIQAVREWFTEIRQNKTEAYECFANELIEAGDCIISFNYDVSLEHELRRAGKWRIGDGYGFTIPEFPSDSPVKLLKLHGSINWLALMFGGITGALQIQPGNVFGLRPVLGSNELAFLGYPDLTDPSFRHPGAAIPTMIMPTRSKEFFFDTNLGREWEGFWDRLWQQAADALKGSDVVVLCWYSLPPADQRARDLLLERENVARGAEIVVSCGADTDTIVHK